MVTGVETAGLVLGSIPLILAGLQFYSEGIGVTKRYWKYREEVSSLMIELRAENCQYVNTINWLLIGVVEQKDMAVFLAEPGGARWKDEKFDRKLKKRLGASYVSYLEVVEHLKSITESFMGRLKLNSAGQAQFTDVNAFKEHYRRLRFSLNKSDYKDLMDRLKQANHTLYTLTVQTSHLAAHQTAVKSEHQPMPNFRLVKRRAEKFHSALSKNWQCPCHANHSVSLRLEPRLKAGRSDSEDEEKDIQHDPFHVLFCFSRHHQTDSAVNPWSWEEADVRIEDQPELLHAAAAPGPASKGVRFAQVVIPKAVSAALASHPNLQPIKDLCSAFSTYQQPQRNVCFSLLANEIAKQKYGVLITPIRELPVNTEQWSVSSLGSVLQDTKFARKDRLKLAVTLASSILQLHETPWLEENWDKESIFFVHRPGSKLYDQSFVAGSFDQLGALPVTTIPAHSSVIIRNQTLYALGVALIELWYQEPITNLYEDIDGPRNTGNDLLDLMAQFKTADRLSEALYDEAGSKYSGAVRRCIRCEFDKRANTLADAQFQKAVYQKVVAQLQENYDYLFQQDLESKV